MNTDDATPAFEEGQIHVWHYDLARKDAEIKELAHFLDSKETDRASRFRFARHKNDFIVCRAVLRDILAHYTGLEPKSLKISYSTLGRAYLDPTACSSDLVFSVSNAGGLGVVAVALNVELGVDVEKIVRNPVRQHLIMSLFCKEEIDWINSFSTEDQSVAFYDLWTSKEAYLKALGLGLTVRINDFCILNSNDYPRLVWSNIDTADSGAWDFHRFQVEPGYSSCLAVKSENSSVRVGHWEK